MEPFVQKILVVGGNGFIGSAVCKTALARGMQVTSISSSGKPYQTPKGHTPAWASKVNWQTADALLPETYAHILPGVTAVVHTLGTLLEDGQYKSAVREGSPSKLLQSLVSGALGSGNPLERGSKGSYEVMNRDSALRVCETFLSSPASVPTNGPRPFVYISAEDVFRPLVPSRYIETKREAEQHIENMMAERPDYRAIYIRPSLVYHAHHRPLTSPLAALLDLTATLHSKLPPSLPSPSSILRSLGTTFSTTDTSSPLDSIANAMTIPPIHVEHVAEAICVALGNDVRGPVGVRKMRELIGWAEKGRPASTSGPGFEQRV